MGQLWTILRLTTFAGLLLIAYEQWRSRDLAHAMLALTVAALAMR